VNPPALSVKRILKRIAPLQAGIVLGCLYATMGLIFVPFLILASMAAANLPPAQRGIFAFVGVGMAIGAPILYGVMGFVGGVIGAALYNLFAKLVGGIEVEVE